MIDAKRLNLAKKLKKLTYSPNKHEAIQAHTKLEKLMTKFDITDYDLAPIIKHTVLEYKQKIDLCELEICKLIFNLFCTVRVSKAPGSYKLFVISNKYAIMDSKQLMKSFNSFILEQFPECTDSFRYGLMYELVEYYKQREKRLNEVVLEEFSDDEIQQHQEESCCVDVEFDESLLSDFEIDLGRNAFDIDFKSTVDMYIRVSNINIFKG
jgi:hypothetical protein